MTIHGIKTPKDVRAFWFAPEVEKKWFLKDENFDGEVRDRFMATYEAARGDRLTNWRATAEDTLSLCLVLDQFPRNMFRGSRRAFESDAQALAVAQGAVNQGFDQEVAKERRAFFYLPFMHAEDLAVQDRAVALYTALGQEPNLGYAKEHRDIIARFGRFPHRNAALGRESTSEERAFLETHEGF
ncbi:DUF924 domain-containing protein [Rhodobacteraceae bacterium]|nr:DUF924 domain-containing protein [Paracoccaceae bacterium]